MNIAPKLPPQMAARLLGGALVSGILAELLLDANGLGINIPLTAIVIIATAAVVCRTNRVVLDGEGRWLAVPLIFFAACLAWRDSPTLNVANSCALLSAATLTVLTARAGQVRRAGMTQYAVGAVYVLAQSATGALTTLRDEVRWRRYRWWSAPAVAATRGVAFAIPPLVIFGILLMAADGSFENLVRTTFSVELPDLIQRVVMSALYAWLVGGALREMLIAPLRPRQWLQVPARLRSGAIETAVVLLLIDLLFCSFVVVQLPYLFGGASEAARLGHSDYTRRGFFELVWVAGLALPLLLWAHWLIRANGAVAQRVYRVLALVMVGLLYVMMTSAAQRMQAYVLDSGLTELRLQASAFMVWLAIVLGWFVLTVLRDLRQHFAIGALVSAWLVIAALDVLAPDAFIVRTNAEFGHLEAAEQFDNRPLASLSADAVPAVLEALPQLPADRQQVVRTALESRLATSGVSSDWRSFNWSRAQAVIAINGIR